MADQPRSVIEARLQDMGVFNTLNTEELLQSDTPEELLRRLEQQSHYAEIASQARHLLQQGETLFALDAALDRRYFAGLARRGAAIDDSSGQMLGALARIPAHGKFVLPRVIMAIADELSFWSCGGSRRRAECCGAAGAFFRRCWICHRR